MTQILVWVPDDDKDAFLAWLSERGYEHQVPSDDVSEWQQEIVLSRIANSRAEDYSDLDEMMARLRKSQP